MGSSGRGRLLATGTRKAPPTTVKAPDRRKPRTVAGVGEGRPSRARRDPAFVTGAAAISQL